MSTSTIILIALAAVIALGFSFFQYFYRSKRKGNSQVIFFLLRSLSIFILLLLLINPKITTRTFSVEKPNLVLAIDNSESIAQLGMKDSVQEMLNEVQEDEELQEKFDLSVIDFGREISTSDSLNFDQPQTDISTALNSLKELFKRKNTAVVLITDGNQTFGRDFSYFRPDVNQEIFPLVIGDTATYADLELSRLNVNRYAFLDNRFPVEAIINYSGREAVTSEFVIRSGERTIYSEKIDLDEQKSSVVINVTLPATSLGVLTYEAEIVPLENEKNTLNNSENFAVEVIDERSRILLLTSIPHPDLGAIKQSVESNQQRELDIKYVQNDDFQIKDYQLVILYQPNTRFKKAIEDIGAAKMNYMIISGTETDWNFLNQNKGILMKDFTYQNQEIFAVMNPNFSQFQFEDIGFEDFPPLEDKFGNVSVNSNALNPMLFQRIEGIATDQPLLAISEEGNRKQGFLLGENIWRWRAASFLRQQSFEEFDDFFGKIIQNLSSKKRRERLSLDFESFYYGNQNVLITAQYFDENYEFDPRAQLEIVLKQDEGDKESTSAFLLRNNSYQVDLGNLESGEYSFSVTAKNSGNAKTGSFRVIDYDVEQQFVSANLLKMKQLATNNGQQLYFPSGFGSLVDELKNDQQYLPVQKSREKSVPLIDWYYLLFLLVLLLAAEWFYRKYLGLI